jgi:acetyl esterase/lipase
MTAADPNHSRPPMDGDVIPLWPDAMPGAKDIGPEQRDIHGITNISQPTLTYLSPAVDRANGTAALICPGGGYSMVSYEREGLQYARWLSTLGITSFILKYRLKEFGHPAPLQDVVRALRLVRSRSGQFCIDPARIGVVGSSAGGHLAACACTLHDHPLAKTGDGLDAVSARPDFAILLYPVITMEHVSAHSGSRQALLGPNPDPADVALLSLEKHVTASHAPTLLIHTQPDDVVPPENSILYYRALTRAGVPAEMHIYQNGPHGMGMNPGLGTASLWPDRARDWLQQRGLI